MGKIVVLHILAYRLQPGNERKTKRGTTGEYRKMYSENCISYPRNRP
jgi:hypothetical protein